MAILGLFTSIGISKSIDAANNEGFYIFPKEFGVSRNTGPLDVSRTSPNSGEWYKSAVSSRVVVDDNTVKIICTIPQGSSLVAEEVREIYLYAEDSGSNEFLLALGQPTETILYDPDGTITLELQISLIDIDLTANYIFNNTIATELAEHITDPNAHPEYIIAMAKAGIFVEGGGIPFANAGQTFAANVEFDGTKAVASAGGINFSSKFNGTEGNAIVLEFDAAKTVDEVVLDWNNANPDNMATHDGVGTEVLPTQTVSLSTGSYVVNDKDVVYRDVDGLYKQAVGDGTIRAKAVGVANRDARCVNHYGLLDYDTVSNGFVVGDIIYLSGSVEGTFDVLNNGIGLGIVLKDGLILFTGFSGNSDVNISQTFDAIVTNVSGLGLFESTQLAIDAVPNYGRILIDKLEEVKDTISTNGKTLEFVTNGVSKGWTKFLGEVSSFRIDFDAVPDNGTWRMEWNGQESADLAYNANAAAVEAEFNLFSGHTGVTVTGDYSSGFVFEFLDEVPQPIPTFIDPGLNEIQRFNFSNIPDDGTIQFEHEGNPTLNFPWDDDATDLELALEALPSISDVGVSGSFAAQYFQIEFQGGVLVDGLQPKSEITAIMTDLDQSTVPTQVNGTTVTPISPITVQQGKFPASNTRIGVNPVAITVTQVSAGEAIGPDLLFELDAPDVRFNGYGLVQDFAIGFDINDQDRAVIALQFENVDLPIKSTDERVGIDSDFSQVLGYAKDLIAQLKLSEHPTNKKRLKISSADVQLPTGVTLSQELDNLLLDFDGAEIDFSTGEIFKADGLSSLGLDFTPVIPASEQYRWASITIVPKLTSADQRLTGQVLVLFGEDDGVDELTAAKAPFGTGKPLGEVVLRGDLGLQEITRIITSNDDFGSLDGKYFIIYDDVGSVAFWIDVDDSGTVEPAHGAARSVEITTIVENDDPNVVAAKIQAVIDADSKFSASVSTNRVIVTDATIGPRTDADIGTTDFFIDTPQQGVDTDVTGLSDISNQSIRQLGVGSGSGSGAGDADAFLQDLKFQLKDSAYSYLVASIFRSDIDALIDSTDGSYSYPKKAWNLDAGEFFESINLLDEEYLNKNLLLNKFSLTLKYADNTDLAAIYEYSLDGINFEAFDMDQLADTDTFTSVIETDYDLFPDVALIEHALVNQDDLVILNQSTTQSYAQKFTARSSHDLAREIEFIVNKLGNPSGFYGIRVIKDAAGSPSTDPNDLVYSSPFRDMTLLSAGLNNVVMSLPALTLEPSIDYHIEFITDQGYKSGGYSGGVNEISIGVDSSAPTFSDILSYNGVTWSTIAGKAAVFVLSGIEKSFKFRMTSSQDTQVYGFGAFYGESQQVNISDYPIEYITFSGNEDRTQIDISKFNIDPDLFVLMDVDTGQSWGFPGLELDGFNSVIVPSGTFERIGETVRLKAFLIGSCGDSSSTNKALLAANHLGTPNGDGYMQNGRGIFLKRPDGTVVEITVDNANNVQATPVP